MKEVSLEKNIHQEKIPCQTVEMMIEPEYCQKISDNGTFCCCEHAKKLGLIKRVEQQ